MYSAEACVSPSGWAEAALVAGYTHRITEQKHHFYAVCHIYFTVRDNDCYLLPVLFLT